MMHCCHRDKFIFIHIWDLAVASSNNNNNNGDDDDNDNNDLVNHLLLLARLLESQWSVCNHS